MTFILYLIYAVLIIGPVYFLYLWWKVSEQKKKIVWSEKQEYNTLLIEVPKNNEKAPLAAEQMFASIHGIYTDSAAFQPSLSFEIVSVDKFVQFYLHVPRHLVDFVEGQIYAQYPTVEISQIDDYSEKADSKGMFTAGCELVLTKPDVFPIKMFSDFEVDPLSGITSVMSKIQSGEEIWLQFIIRPVGDDWQERGIDYIDRVKKGTDKAVGFKDFHKHVIKTGKEFGRNFVKLALNPNAELEGVAAASEIKLSGPVEEALKSIEFKIVKLGFETKIRLVAVAADPVAARTKVQSLAAAFKQFNTTNGNGFKHSEIVVNNEDFINSYKSRNFEDKGYVLNISELAAIYHLPNQTVETPHIVWAGSKKGEPPSNLPLVENIEAENITVLGETNFRNVYRKFGIKLDDRRRHCYIIGKSGTGKSTLIENMAIDDVMENRGVIIVDPHGDLVDKVLACMPDDRINDVIVFDPADRAFPIAFNLLDKVEDDFKGMVASGFVGIFKKIFGESWGPRLEHILRNTVLALLDFPESTMLDIPRMLTEKRFREKVVSFVTDTVIKEFWINEFAQYDVKFRTEAVSPILNKVGQFLSSATIRNIVGQPHSRINIREIMDSKKILLINLSRGKIGEDNSALLGAMMITKIQLSAMSRADVTIDNRPDCYLYVDEFQNFATESFAVILSEARKYNLNLTIANQYITQMPEIVRDAVFGNAGTIIAFRVGGTDADFLVKEFEPVFEANDLVNLDRYQIYTKLLIDGITKPAFSARTLPPFEKISGNRDQIIETSRKNYAANRSEVETMIIEKSRELEEELKAESDNYFANRLNQLASVDRVSDKQFERVDQSKPAVAPVSTPIVAQSSAISEPKQEIGLPVEENNQQDANQDAPRDKKIRYLKWQNMIGDKIYKEQTARGGVKWFVGQKITPEMFVEQGISIDQSGKEMIKIMEKAYDVRIETGEGESKPEKKDDDTPPKSGGPDKDEALGVISEQKMEVEPDKKLDEVLDVKASEDEREPKEERQPVMVMATSDENPLQEGVAISLD
ncbi:MAG: type IV secretion system DNA-binding domain-containing protein [Candidatus Berkelbacteria bacterium]|nr:type IV secretion system DNA-binding domain-containing protein [Candidatus Berkelbacteria bacterium]